MSLYFLVGGVADDDFPTRLATLSAAFIALGGLLDNRSSGNIATIAGNIVLYIGLAIAAVAGIPRNDRQPPQCQSAPGLTASA